LSIVQGQFLQLFPREDWPFFADVDWAAVAAATFAHTALHAAFEAGVHAVGGQAQRSNSFRQTIVQLLLASHPDDGLYYNGEP
jgi:hypothetical protein